MLSPRPSTKATLGRTKGSARKNERVASFCHAGSLGPVAAVESATASATETKGGLKPLLKIPRERDARDGSWKPKLLPVALKANPLPGDAGLHGCKGFWVFFNPTVQCERLRMANAVGSTREEGGYLGSKCRKARRVTPLPKPAWFCSLRGT